MKGFFKFIFSLLGLFAAFVGALVVADGFLNRNRIKGDYLDCDSIDSENM